MLPTFKFSKFSFSVVTLFILTAITLMGCIPIGESQPQGFEKKFKIERGISLKKATSDNTLRIATLNIAHGRKDSFSQFFLRKNTIQKNLDDISSVLKQYKPQVVALQEADANESFNHVKYLATQSQYPWLAQVSNVNWGAISYGTALLSTLPLTDAIKHTFSPSWPTLNKGFVLAQLAWPSADNTSMQTIDLVSVHLDFLRASVRTNQIQEMVDVLSTRNNPTIIMGDFNSDWFSDDSIIKELSAMTGFSAYHPESSAYNTYNDKRLDWILISNELEFTGYKVLPDILSDHAMVIAEIHFIPN